MAYGSFGGSGPVVGAIGYAWLGVGLLGIVNAFTHPESDWVHADRNRPFWVVLLFFLGPVGLLIYLAAVWPRFPRGKAGDGRFTRES